MLRANVAHVGNRHKFFSVQSMIACSLTRSAMCIDAVLKYGKDSISPSMKRLLANIDSDACYDTEFSPDRCAYSEYSGTGTTGPAPSLLRFSSSPSLWILVIEGFHQHRSVYYLRVAPGLPLSQRTRQCMLHWSTSRNAGGSN